MTVVCFSGEQKLYERYGGEEGKLVRSGDLLIRSLVINSRLVSKAAHEMI